ncbi:hypothetical protein V1224_07055 [Lachnospiraceae bacterium JLR.KK008]
MARGQRKSIEEKIAEKESMIDALKVRLKSEQRELEELKQEKREVDLKTLNEVLQEAKMSALDAVNVIREYVQEKADPA